MGFWGDFIVISSTNYLINISDGNISAVFKKRQKKINSTTKSMLNDDFSNDFDNKI